MLGPKGPTVAAEGYSPRQELEKAARRGAIFLVKLKGERKIWQNNKINYVLNFPLENLVYLLPASGVLGK